MTHCENCGIASCCNKEGPQVVRITFQEGYIKGWSTDQRTGSEPFDFKDAKSISRAVDSLVSFLTNNQAAYVHFDD